MESPHLNPEPEEEALLRELFQKASPELPDNGFSGRVLRALPQSAAPSPWLLGSLEGAVGLLIALIVLLLRSDSGQLAQALLMTGRQLLEAFSAPLVSIALGTTCASLAASYLFVRWQTR